MTVRPQYVTQANLVGYAPYLLALFHSFHGATYVVDMLTHPLEEWYNTLNRAGMYQLSIVVPQACPEVVCQSALF